MAQIEKLHKAQPKNVDSESDLKKLLGVASVVENGKKVFSAKCAVCHGENLQGLIGPNLTDEYWLHGKGMLADIEKTVREGIADKGMPTWEGQLKPEELQAVVVFVASKQGSHPANAKAPQGEKVAN